MYDHICFYMYTCISQYCELVYNNTLLMFSPLYTSLHFFLFYI